MSIIYNKKIIILGSILCLVLGGLFFGLSKSSQGFDVPDIDVPDIGDIDVGNIDIGDIDIGDVPDVDVDVDVDFDVDVDYGGDISIEAIMGLLNDYYANADQLADMQFAINESGVGFSFVDINGVTQYCVNGSNEYAMVEEFINRNGNGNGNGNGGGNGGGGPGDPPIIVPDIPVVPDIIIPPAPTVDLKAGGADSVTIDYNASVNLTWTSTNASSCIASGSWSGNKGAAGTQSTGTLTSSRTYTITCMGTGSAVDSVTVQVNPPVNNPPTVSNLQVSMGDYCSSPVHYLSWTYSDPEGDSQDRFRLQIDNNSDFESLEIDRNINSSANSQAILVMDPMISGTIGYNDVYYWRIRVYDDQGGSSNWVQGSSFSTEKHRYPAISFSWSPQNPSEGEEVRFTDQSTVYGGASKTAWNWIFVNADPPTSEDQNPVIEFTSQGNNAVTLSVTDSDNYTCPSPVTVGVQESLPWWKEIIPW